MMNGCHECSNGCCECKIPQGKDSIMMSKLKDVIISWANGKQIQYSTDGINFNDVEGNIPDWSLYRNGVEFRVKPEYVKKTIGISLEDDSRMLINNNFNNLELVFSEGELVEAKVIEKTENNTDNDTIFEATFSTGNASKPINIQNFRNHRSFGFDTILEFEDKNEEWEKIKRNFWKY